MYIYIYTYIHALLVSHAIPKSLGLSRCFHGKPERKPKPHPRNVSRGAIAWLE